jgi:hypothetical protein
VLVLAGCEFVLRGPARAVHVASQFNDLMPPYAQARAWVHGLDPYSPASLLREWPPDAPFTLLAPEVADGSLIAKRGMPTGYPVTSLVLLAPLCAISWTHAYALWIILNLLLFAVMVCALVGLSGFSYRDPPAMLLIAGALALAPFHTGIVTGNVALVAVELGVIAFWSSGRGRDVAAAILLAISIGLKPQIGVCFLLYYLIRGRWRVVGTAVAGLGLIAAVGLLRLEVGQTPWLANYLNDNHVLLQTGILANFTGVNPTRYGLVNLQVVLYPLLSSVNAANGAAALVGVTLLVGWIAAMWRTRPQAGFELLDLSAIAVISLLPVYHRFYDAALLVLPLCWALASWSRARVAAKLSLVVMLPFLIPGGTLLESLQASGRIPAAWAGRWLWEAVVKPHEVWMLLCLSLLLLYEMIASLDGARAQSARVEVRREAVA